MQISVLIPTLNEKENLLRLIPKLQQILPQLVSANEYEIILIDGGSHDGTQELASQLNVQLIRQRLPGYGGAIQEGFRFAQGMWIFTLDADLSHGPMYFHSLWRLREEAEIIIASRYVPGGKVTMPLVRIILSRILNFVFSYGLSMQIKDMSSGFRLYRKSAIEKMLLISRDFDILEEILIRAYAEGWRIREVPFHYYLKYTGQTHAKLIRFGIAFLRTFYRMWVLRNSIQSADYDARAYDSIIPLQRYWQRKRVQLITRFAEGHGRKLDVGCGSSRIISRCVNVVGTDIQLNKLRYLHYRINSSLPLVNSSIFQLPFQAACFDVVICSQVIEHLPTVIQWMDELDRVLKPGGMLILGTPDYNKLSWRVIEFLYRLFAPSGYADEHITHYTFSSLYDLLANDKFQLVNKRYICNAELILVAKKIA